MRGRLSLAFVVCAVLTLGLILAPFAAAQGCSMCYQSAAAGGSRAIQALRNGIVILVVPPFFICTAITYLVYRRRNLHDQNS